MTTILRRISRHYPYGRDAAFSSLPSPPPPGLQDAEGGIYKQVWELFNPVHSLLPDPELGFDKVSVPSDLCSHTRESEALTMLLCMYIVYRFLVSSIIYYFLYGNSLSLAPGVARKVRLG